MSNQLESLLIDLLASTIFAGMAICFALLVSYFTRRSKRVKRLKALKLDTSKEDIYLPVFTAHLVISKGEARLVDGTKSMHFEGSAVPIREIEAAYLVKEQLEFRLLKEIPESLRNWLMKHYKGYNKIEFDVRPAPLNTEAEISRPHMIIIGGPEFNTLTHQMLEKANFFTILDAPDCVNPLIRLNLPGGEYEIIQPDSQKYNLGLVQRVSLSNDSQTLLFLVGVGTNGTLSAVHWFIKNWDRIDKMFGDKNFGIVLECPKRQVEPDGYKRATIRKMCPQVQSKFL